MEWNVDEYRRTVFAHLGLRFTGRDQVLDLGCGDGGDADWFAQRVASTVGIDLVEHPRWAQLARPDLSFACADAQSLAFPDDSFDLVFLKDVLHHADSPDRVLREAHRVCVPGGSVCIVEGNRFNPLLYVHMTLMLGHQHFRRPLFQRIVRAVYPQARFVHFEAHVYPFAAPVLVGLARALQNAIGATPGIERLAAYNAAIATC
jgi:ubiquinone/menaquinone biosynthesis C-methylase UbiE